MKTIVQTEQSEGSNKSIFTMEEIVPDLCQCVEIQPKLLEKTTFLAAVW